MRCILCHLNSWGCGHSDSLIASPDGIPVRTIVTESADVLPALLDSDLCGEGTVVFSPSRDTPSSVGKTIIAPYTGSLSAPGDEMVVGEICVVKVQEYELTPYLATASPTFVRINNEDDFYTFLEHADHAHQHGAFLPALLHPMVRLADLCALGGAHTCGGPSQRLFVRATGQASTTPWGMPLGSVTDGLASLTATWSAFRRPSGSGCPGCLSQAVPAPLLRIAHQQRPWLSRYLQALDALRTAAERGLSPLKVSGFPHRLTAGADDYLPALDLMPAGAEMPLLLFSADVAVLHDTHSHQQFELGTGTARLIELLMIHGDSDAAVYAATQHLGLERHAAHAALAQVRAGLVGFGIQLSTARGSEDASCPPSRQGSAFAHGVNASCWLASAGMGTSNHSLQPVPGPRSQSDG